MQILSQLTTTTTIYEVIVEENRYTYKEYLDERGKIIDWELFNDKDELIYDDVLAEYIAEQIYM
jgi:hypothetical protein